MSSPVRVVVVGFAGQHDAVVAGAAPTTCPPRWWPAAGTRWRPGCSAGRSGSPAADLDDGVAQARPGRGRRSAPPAGRCRWSIRRARVAGSTARSTTPLCDSSQRAVGERRRRRRLDRHADGGRAHRGHHAVAAQRRRHRGERRVTPQRCCAAPAPRLAPSSDRRSPRPSRRRSSGRASAGAAHRTAPAARTGGSSTSEATDTRRHPASPGADTSATSQARRTPEKICRRIGWSQLRKLGRRMPGATAHEPPRSTL